MVKFSEREEKIIKIIGKINGKATTIQAISDKLFEDEPNTLDAETKVSGCLSRIVKKCEHYKLPWSLEKKKVIGTCYKSIRRISV